MSILFPLSFLFNREKDFQPLFRKKNIFSWVIEINKCCKPLDFSPLIDLSEETTTSHHIHAENDLVSCNPCLINISLSTSPNSAIFLTIMLPRQAPTVTVRIHLLQVRFVLTRQYFDSLLHFVWLIAFDFNWFPFQTNNHCSKHTVWKKCQFCCNILESLLPP